MGRPKGSKNRTWREVEAAGRALIKQAKLMRQVEALKTGNKSAPKTVRKAAPKTPPKTNRAS